MPARTGAEFLDGLRARPRKIWVDMYFIFNGAKNVDAGYAYLNTALSPQGQATMAKTMELSVSNQEAYKQLPADLVKKLGYDQANELIAGSEFNILPDPDAKAPNVSVRDLYTAFDEIKAAVKK